MASNRFFKFGPLLLTTTTTTNILNPGTTTGGVNSTSSPLDKLYIVLRHIRVTNNGNANQRFALWLGATGTNTVGKEFAWAGTATAGALDASVGQTVSNGSYVEWFGLERLDTVDFLVGGASAANVLTIEGEGEIGVA